MNKSKKSFSGQEHRLENLNKIQLEIQAKIQSCISELQKHSPEAPDSYEILVSSLEDINISQKRQLGKLFYELLGLQSRQRYLLRQINDYVAKSGLSGYPNPCPLPKYICPHCDYVFYRISPQELLPVCPVHKVSLIHKI